MKTLRTTVAVRRWRKTVHSPVVFVPTMGALHHGHAALIRRARLMAGPSGVVVVSIFVNPSQFGPKEDFSSYPRPLADDLRISREAGADAVFCPTASEMYAPDRSIWISEESLSETLCGRSRPGHFRGVGTVVAKLFLIVQPDTALFGEKDWQQLAILRRMVRDLNFPVRVVGHPTVRENDGLATSSRNAYLTPDERKLAPRIFSALTSAAATPHTPARIARAAHRVLSAIPGARVDYVEAVDAATLQPLKDRSKPGRLAAAVFLGKARLIDNVPIRTLP